MRALDVGTWDGFWAFEMERRGAEVVALDLDDERELDWPPAGDPPSTRDAGAATASGWPRRSSARRSSASTAASTTRRPEELGTFDLVFCGTVLIHLRDQLLALGADRRPVPGHVHLRRGVRPLSGLIPFPVARYHADRDNAVVFWQPSIRTWKRMLWTAGFERVERNAKFAMQAKGFTVRHVVLHGHK